MHQTHPSCGLRRKKRSDKIWTPSATHQEMTKSGHHVSPTNDNFVGVVNQITNKPQPHMTKMKQEFAEQFDNAQHTEILLKPHTYT